jgi:ABC-type transport system involved in multi-copper enzyme maturation permease subunit
MNPLLTTAQFEFRYHLRQPTFYLFAALILIQGIWAAHRMETLYLAGDPTINAYSLLSSFGLVLAIITVLLAGQSLTKDADFNTIPYLYSLPITSRIHFAGRFLGTYLTALTLATFYPIGTLLKTSDISTVPWEALIDGFIRLLALNSFIIVSITFSLTVFMRSIRGAYVSLFLVVLYFLLTESSETAHVGSDIWLLLDPFGVGMMRESINTLAYLADPDTLLSFSDMLFINRLLWIGLALGILAQAETHFSFDTFGYKHSNKLLDSSKTKNLLTERQRLPAVQLEFGKWTQWQTTIRLAKLEFQNLIRQPAFQITIGLLIVLAVMLASVSNLNPDFPELPITSRMTALRLPMGLFIGLALIVMTGELIFYERTTGFWPIYDALPQPNFVLLFAKLIAMFGVAILLTLILFLVRLSLQIGDGFTDIDWKLYASDLLMDGLLRYCQLIALSALVAVLINNRMVSHLSNLLIFCALTISYQLTMPDEAIFLYSFLPGSASYSDLIGYSSNAAIRPAMHTLWWGITSWFIVLFLLFWNRGLSDGLRGRVSQWRAQLDWSYGLVFIVSGLFFYLGLWQLQESKSEVASVRVPIQYTSQLTIFRSIAGNNVSIQVKYHHSYQVSQILKVTKAALQRGEQLFGAYPYASLQILEIPVGSVSVRSKPGQIAIAEKQGWTADYRQPQKLDHIDYLISREVFKQWLVHRMNPLYQSGEGFVRQSLAEYLALQQVSRHYGSERLKQRLVQRQTLYITSRNHNRKPEISLLQSNGNDALERGRAALALTSIGQVWGDAPLSLTIGQFYQQAIQKPTSATANEFATTLAHRLPDSLRYLTTYLNDQVWFDFKIGHLANLPNGLMVEVISTKWREHKPNQRQPLTINDFIPLVVLNKDGREIYRQLIRPNPDDRFISLPALPAAKTVVIDPLGAWPEPNKYDNYKIL